MFLKKRMPKDEVAFPMTRQEAELFLNTIDHGRGPVMEKIHKMTGVEIDRTKNRIRLMLSDEFGIEPKV